MKLIKYIKVYIYIFKMSWMDKAAYRFNFFIWFVINFLILVISILFFSIIFGNAFEVNGWNYEKSLILIGITNLMFGIGAITYYPFMYTFSGNIQSGKLDFKLIKPLDIQFLATIPFCDVEDVMLLINSLIIFIYTLPKISSTGFFEVLAFLILFLSSNIILYSIVTLFQTIAFKVVKIQSLTEIIWNVVSIGKFPVKIFDGILRTLFMIIIPAGLLITVPAEVLTGTYDWKWIATSLILAILLFVISRKAFLNGIKHYSSASS
jgi:ABC-2 type transport system permease protein